MTKNILFIVEDDLSVSNDISYMGSSTNKFAEVISCDNKATALLQIARLAQSEDIKVLLLCDAGIPEDDTFKDFNITHGIEVALTAQTQLGSKVEIKGIGTVQSEWPNSLGEWIGKDQVAYIQAIVEFGREKRGVERE